MDPGLLAAACGAGCAPGLFVPGGGGRIPFAVFPAGAEETTGADGPGPGEGLAARALRRARGPRRAGGVDSGARRPGDPKWGNQGVPQAGMGRDAPRIRGPGAGRAEGLETAREALWRAPRRVPENAGVGGAPGAWHGVQGGPATQDVANERGLFVRQPVPHLGDRGLERPGQALGQADGVAHHAAAMGDAWRPGTPGQALGAGAAACREGSAALRGGGRQRWGRRWPGWGCRRRESVPAAAAAWGRGRERPPGARRRPAALGPVRGRRQEGGRCTACAAWCLRRQWPRAGARADSPPVGRCPPLGGTPPVWQQPSRSREKPPRCRVLAVSGVLSQRV